MTTTSHFMSVSKPTPFDTAESAQSSGDLIGVYGAGFWTPFVTGAKGIRFMPISRVLPVLVPGAGAFEALFAQ